MGQESAAKLREIERIRERIDADLEELGRTLPPKEQLLRAAAVAAGGGLLAVLLLWYLGHRYQVARTDRRVKRLVKEAIVELNRHDG